MIPPRRFIPAATGVAVLLAASAGWVASTFPDGLEKVAEHLGFGDRATPAVLKAPMPDYILPVLGGSPWSGAVAGTAGVIAAFAAAWGLGRLLQLRKRAARLRR